MRANPLRGQVGGGWAPVKWYRAVRRVPFGAQKVPVQAPQAFFKVQENVLILSHLHNIAKPDPYFSTCLTFSTPTFLLLF
jgi:hypothetical protein